MAYSRVLYNVTLAPSWRVDWNPVTGGKYGVSMEANAIDWGLRMEGKTLEAVTQTFRNKYVHRKSSGHFTF